MHSPILRKSSRRRSSRPKVRKMSDSFALMHTRLAAAQDQLRKARAAMAR